MFSLYAGGLLDLSYIVVWICVLCQVCCESNAMATCPEDYLIDDEILTRQFSGTLSFNAETASSQTSVDGMEHPVALMFIFHIFIHFFIIILLLLL